MAGEKVGKLFEAVVMAVLVDGGYEANWEIPVDSVSVDPDITIGSPAKPTHWLLLTSSISAKNSLEKFWRNAGELFDVKKHIEGPPVVISLILESKQREGLRKASNQLFDSQILVGEKQSEGGLGCKKLTAWIKANAASSPSGDAEKLETVRLAAATDSSFRAIYMDFSNRLLPLVAASEKMNPGLWKLHRNLKRSPRNRRAKETYFRRGMGKLLALGLSEAVDLVKSGQREFKNDSFQSVYSELGFFKKTIKSLQLIDPEIVWVLEHHAASEIIQVLASCYKDRSKNWDAWTLELQNESELERTAFVLGKYGDLSTPSGMKRELLNHVDSGEFKWLFALVMELVKKSTGKKQGYGYGPLSEDVGYTDGISQGYLLLSDWVNGHASNTKAGNLVTDVSRALSRRLKEIGPSKAKRLLSGIREESKSNLLEQKILSYWLFEPIPMLVESCLVAEGLDFERTRKHPHLVSELVDDGRTGYSHVVTVSETLIYWKSAYDQGRHHKTKELSGRIAALRYSKKSGWSLSDGIRQYFLVLDGTFTVEQVRVLIGAGWDEVFYPDEMGKLAKAIV